MPEEREPELHVEQPLTAHTRNRFMRNAFPKETHEKSKHCCYPPKRLTLETFDVAGEEQVSGTPKTPGVCGVCRFAPGVRGFVSCRETQYLRHRFGGASSGFRDFAQQRCALRFAFRPARTH
jgi:hypothetical protein